VQRQCDHADGQNWLATDLGCLHFNFDHPGLFSVVDQKRGEGTIDGFAKGRA
jgi:hypothetical protein